MGNHCNICSFNCWGRKGYDASCCTLEDRNWIIGPHTDTEAFLGRLSERIGRKVEFQEVFYDYEEGHKKFPDKEVWQSGFCGLIMFEKAFIPPSFICKFHSFNFYSIRIFIFCFYKN